MTAQVTLVSEEKMTESIAKYAARTPAVKLGHAPPDERENLTQSFESLAKKLDVVFPKFSSIVEVRGTDFGRNIEKRLRALQISPAGILKVKLRREPAAAVIPWERYEAMQVQITELKAQLKAVAQAKRLQELSDKGDEFDALFARMQTAEHVAAGETMRRVTGADLRETFAPGKTEQGA